MISLWKLIKMAQRWQRVAALRRKRISFLKASGSEEQPGSVAGKGHFVVYTADKKRFEFPIKYLNNSIISELFILSEEVFGLPSDGPIMLPCDASSMDHIISLIRGNKGKVLQKYDLTISVPTGGCSSFSTQQSHLGQQFLACS